MYAPDVLLLADIPVSEGLAKLGAPIADHSRNTSPSNSKVRLPILNADCCAGFYGVASNAPDNCKEGLGDQ